MDDELLKVRDMATSAQKMADQAVSLISSHEAVCAERYTNIKDRLSGIPRLFEIIETGKKEATVAMDDFRNETSQSIDELRKWVYIGIGMCTIVPVALEAVQYFRGH